MNLPRRRALRLSLAMAATAAAALYLKPPRLPGSATPRLDLDRLIPARFGPWQVDRVAATFVRAADRRGVQTRLYDQVLERTFVNDQGQRIMLSVAYGAEQSSDMQLHRPEVCYRAGGFEVRDASPAILQLDQRALPVTRVLAAMPGRPEPITYWTVVGGRAVSGGSTLLERLALTARRERNDGLLVRVSSIDADSARAYELHEDFTEELVRALTPADRIRFIGAALPG